MRKTLKSAAYALLLTLASTALGQAVAGGGERLVAQPAALDRNSVMTIPASASFPITRKVAIGAGKSFMVQFPFGLKDVLVSDPGKVDAVVQSSDRVFLIAKQAGATNAFFFDENGNQVLTIEISVGADLGGLEDLLRRLLPGSNVRAEIAGSALVLTGAVRTPLDSNRAAEIALQFAEANEDLIDQSVTTKSATSGATGNSANSTSTTQSGRGGQKKVINLISVEGEEQVMLRVTVAEVQRSLLKQFGINVGALINSGNFTTAVLTENALPLTAAAGLGTLPVPGVATTGTSAGQLSLFNTGPNGAGNPFGNSGIATAWQTGNQAIAGAIRALERDGLVKTLAEPNLTAVSGEAANFLAGGEFPVPVVDSNGQQSVSFKKFGVGVSFTPIVLSEGRISLKIETEVSELSNDGAVVLSGISIPALRTRQAKSTVELPSGGSLAIAGLLSEDTRQNIDGFPGLKDVPILGTLFRSRDFVKSETELVVIVTPYVVRPTARKDLARPIDGLAAASDKKANFLGHLNRIYGRGTALPAGDLKGDYGFIVE